MQAGRIPVVAAIKALASQLIVWHHLAFYGPMSDVVYPWATGLIDWLYDDARIAVQAFFVVGGFLAARSLLPALEAGRKPAVPALLWRRYLRLARPYLVALALAVAAAAFARALIAAPHIPAAPTAGQVAAHVFLLQDVLEVAALSAGTWYVAIDFQLYAVLLLALWAASRIAAVTGARASRVALALCLGLALASLFWFNRDPAWDVWAPYFFGAYGLGVLAHWLSTQPAIGRNLALAGAVVAAALAVEWRSRLLVAALTALLLVACARGRFAPRWLENRALAALGRISYAVFLVHYPVLLAVGAVVYRLWPDSVAGNALGMALAWLLSLAAGALLQRLTERAGPAPEKAAR